MIDQRPTSQPVPQPAPPPDDEIDLREVLNVLLRNRWVIAGCVVITVALAALYTYLQRPVWEAAVAIRIDDEQPSAGALNMFAPFARGSEVATEMEALASRTLAEGVVDSLALQVVVVEPRVAARGEVLAWADAERTAPGGEYRLTIREDGTVRVMDVGNDVALGTFAATERIRLPGAAVHLTPGAVDHGEVTIHVRRFRGAVAGLRSRLHVGRPNRVANFVGVGYESTDTVLVHAVPNELAAQFIVRRQRIKKTEARSTVAFLEQQIDTLAGQLRAAENALREFREGQQVVSLEAEADAQVGRLVDLQAGRDQVEAERAALARLLEEIEREAAIERGPGDPSPYRRLMGYPSLLRNQATSQLLGSLATVENERAALLNTMTFDHPDVMALTQRIHDLERQLQAIARTYLTGLTNEVESLDAALARFGDQLEQIPAKEIRFARLQRQTALLEEIYLLLQTRLKEAEIAAAVEDPSVRIVDPAIRSREPISPRPMPSLLFGLLLGGILGVGTAFAREYMDTSVHTREDVQEATGLAVLAVIPRIEQSVAASRNGASRTTRKPAAAVRELEARMMTGHDPSNPASEAYRMLRTNISFARPAGQAPTTMVVTSPAPADGKSTSASNLAITLVQQGRDVLLVDADMRRGVLHGIFHTPREPGLSNVLIGDVDVEDAVRRVDLGDAGTLHFLSTGTLPPNPAELLGSERLRTLLERLEERYDAIILDAPPLAVVTDAAILGSNADGVLVVARASRTEKGALAYALEQLRNVRAPLLGAVLNDVDFRRDGRYYGRYGSTRYLYDYPTTE